MSNEDEEICVFLYTNSVDESIKQMNSTSNFISAHQYYFYYYNPILSKGFFIINDYRYRNLEERKAIYERIEKETELHPYRNLNINQRENRNMYFDLSKYLSIFFSICGKLQPSKKIPILLGLFKTNFEFGMIWLDMKINSY